MNINFRNFTKILDSIEGVKTIKLTGKDYPSEEVLIEDVNMNKFFNMITLKNFYSKKQFNLRNISMSGKYNIIELTNIPKGTFTISIDNELNQGIMYEQFNQNKKVDNVLKKLKKKSYDGKILIVENCKTDDITIDNVDLDKAKVYYLTDIEAKTENKSVDLNINYNHGRLILVLENIKANLVINNTSDKIIRKNMIEEDEYFKNQIMIENFKNTRNYTSYLEIIIIIFILFIVYKILTKFR